MVDNQEPLSRMGDISELFGLMVTVDYDRCAANFDSDDTDERYRVWSQASEWSSELVQNWLAFDDAELPKIRSRLYQVGPASEGPTTVLIEWVFSHKDEVWPLLQNAQSIVWLGKSLRMLWTWKTTRARSGTNLRIGFTPSLLAHLCCAVVNSRTGDFYPTSIEWFIVSSRLGDLGFSGIMADATYLIAIKQSSLNWVFTVRHDGQVTNSYTVHEGVFEKFECPNLNDFLSNGF